MRSKGYWKKIAAIVLSTAMTATTAPVWAYAEAEEELACETLDGADESGEMDLSAEILTETLSDSQEIDDAEFSDGNDAVLFSEEMDDDTGSTENTYRDGEVTEPPTVEKNGYSGNIYANGNALILKAGNEENSKKTVIYIDSNGNGEIDDGETFWVDGTILTNQTDEGNDLSAYTIYGGSKEKDIEGNTRITMLGGNVNNIYGGGYNYSVKKNTVIEINGGSINGLIYGGGYNGKIEGNTDIKLTGGQAASSVFGGGNFKNADNQNADVLGSTNVSVSGDFKFKNNNSLICGGGEKSSCGSTNVYVGAGVQVEDIYGGCRQGDVNGDVSIKLDGEATNIYGGTNSGKFGNSQIDINGTVTGMVYGSGYNAASTEKATINIKGRVQGNVYGGASGGTIGNVNITIWGTVERDVYGGGSEEYENTVNGNIHIGVRDGGIVKGNIRTISSKKTSLSNGSTSQLDIIGNVQIGSESGDESKGIYINKNSEEKIGFNEFNAVGLGDDAFICVILQEGFSGSFINGDNSVVKSKFSFPGIDAEKITFSDGSVSVEETVAPAKYNITCHASCSANGTTTIQGADGKTINGAAEGDKVTVVTNADNGYQQTSIEVYTTVSNQEVVIENVDYGVYAFTMPAEDVTVYVTYSKGDPGPDTDPQPDPDPNPPAPTIYGVTYTLENLTAKNPVSYVTSGYSFKTVLEAAEHFLLPETVELKMGSRVLEAEKDYTYDKTTGEIYLASVYGSITLTAAGTPEPTPSPTPTPEPSPTPTPQPDKPGNAMIASVDVSKNKAVVNLTGESENADGYDYVIGKKSNCIKTKDYLKVNKNKTKTETTFTYLPKGTYYAYCHAWKRVDGKKVFGKWSEAYSFKVTTVTPQTPKIKNVTRKGSTVTVTYTKTKDATGYDIVLGREKKKVNNELRPVNYKPYVISAKGTDKVTVTFKNVKKGTYYVSLHAWNRTGSDKTKVFSPWAGIKTVKVQ